MTRSSGLERVKRNVNGFRSSSENRPTARLYPWRVKQHAADASRFAEREVHGVDDAGNAERIVVWIERKADGMWAVGRAVNPQFRPSDEPKPDDYVFEGWELDDAIERGNEVLEDDVTVSEDDGMPERVQPFLKDDVLKTLERWFYRQR